MPNYSISGCRVQSFLLERGRVSWQANGERNYHIFYQFLAYCRNNPSEKVRCSPAFSSSLFTSCLLAASVLTCCFVVCPFSSLPSRLLACSRVWQMRYLTENVKFYDYLNHSNCWSIAGVDDAVMFENLRRALTVLDVDTSMQVCRNPDRASMTRLCALVVWPVHENEPQLAST